MNFDIVVVSNTHRKSLISPYLDKLNVKYETILTPDFNLPPDFKIEPQYKSLVANHLGAYRCLRGHQLAAEISKSDHTLIFEDDAVPNRPDWFEYIQQFLHHFSDENWLECISLHGRMFDIKKFTSTKNNSEILYPIGSPFIVAGLAYFVNKQGKEKIINHKYNGLPLDLFLYWKLNYILVNPSPFNHDRSEGSLIDIGVHE
jgi:hypothetical protein